MSDYKYHTPWWMAAIIVIVMIPALIIPAMGNSPDMEDPMQKYLTWFYPAYVIGTGICAYICYPQRKALAWILIVLMVMSHAAMLMIGA